MGYIFVTRDRCGGCSIQRKNPCIHGLHFCNPQRMWSFSCAEIYPFVLVGFACELMVRLIEKYASAFLGYKNVTQKGCGCQSYRATDFCNPQRRWSLPCADIYPFVLVGFACELMVRLIEEYASAFLGYIFVTRNDSVRLDHILGCVCKCRRIFVSCRSVLPKGDIRMRKEDSIMKKFIYSLYYGIYSLNNGRKTSAIISLLITLNLYPILKLIVKDGAEWMSIWVFCLLLVILMIFEYFKEKDILEYCEKRPADYKEHACQYIVISVLIVLISCVVL